MRLARKLQLAYLSLILIPMLIVSSAAFITYFLGTSSLGPYENMEAPGWLKPELASIFDEDWARYSKLNERVIIFIMTREGFLSFPEFTSDGPVPESYPHIPSSDPESGKVLKNLSTTGNLASLPDLYAEFGTEWTIDINVSPIKVRDNPYIVGWRKPRVGIAGFMSRRGWIIPLFILTGILLLPALIDAKLRKSVKRLQDAAVRLSSGKLDEPIIVYKRDDLANLAESLESTRIELKDVRDRKARFLMAVSHDLRTPLTSIKGYIEALGDGMAETEEDFTRYLSVLESKTLLLENRIGELIDFARSETGGWKRPSGSVDAKELIRRLDASFRQDSGFSRRNYRSEIEIPEGLTVAGDFDALYRAWENLYANALRHTSDGDSVRFKVYVEGESEPLFLVGEVSDAGRGVDDDFIPLLFEPFARADRGRNAEGLGLGLASVKAVAEAHSGSVSYRPDPAGG
ncbi:MAG: HAMP domain-containing histidine kinase, partial [Spirochaetaceae bacterium]|nr:HAMP domain-containing histidine kinase [Spirochaetaceae bacterium]